jgi:hypothetical protein
VTVFAGDVIAASDINRRVGTAEAITDGSTTSATTELLNVDQVTCAVTAGRKYRVKWVFKYTGTVAADRFVIRVRITGAIEIESNVFLIPATGNTFTEILECDWTAVATGFMNFAGSIQRVSGTGTATPKGASTSHRTLTVDLAD